MREKEEEMENGRNVQRNTKPLSWIPSQWIVRRLKKFQRIRYRYVSELKTSGVMAVVNCDFVQNGEGEGEERD